MDFTDEPAGPAALRGTQPDAAAPVAEPPAAAAEPAAGSDTPGLPMHPALARLLGDGAPGPDQIDRFIARNRFPLVEPTAVTVVFRGEADAVWLRLFMRGTPDGLPLAPVAGTDLWQLRLAVPRGTRFEYKLDVVRHGEGQWINDPLNPRLATDPFGANSVAHAHGYVAPAWTAARPGTPAGRLEEIAVRSRAFRAMRRLRVYLPAGYTEARRYPLVIVHDGEDFVAHAGLATALDTLIHRGEVPPFIAALSQPHRRNDEYTDDPRHAAFVARELLPSLRRRFPIDRRPAGRVLMGASLGAVASLSTVVRHPGLFGALALKSGSFIYDRGLLERRDPLFEAIADFVDRLRDDPPPLPPRVFVSCGRFEGLIGQNRILARHLRAEGVRVRFVESGDAHHWQNWRDQLAASLRWTLPAAAPGR